MAVARILPEVSFTRKDKSPIISKQVFRGMARGTLETSLIRRKLEIGANVTDGGRVFFQTCRAR